MNRYDQYIWFRDAVISLLIYSKEQGIPVRGGEWNRPDILARIYSTGINLWNKGLQLVWPKVGVLKSDHTQSLALDLWIIDVETGKKILWNDVRYSRLGSYWMSLGGFWFEKDPYHFEIKGDPL
jgi:hypothetical protein